MLKLATLCYVKRPGQTLMIHRIKKAGDMHQGKWNGLGGKFEPGETPEACAVREIFEESGLRAADPELRGLLTFPGFQEEEDWYAFVFVVRDYHGELIDSPEGVLAWIDDDRLLELPLWEGDRIFLPWLDDERFFSGRFVYHAGELAEHSVVFYPLPAPGSLPHAHHPDSITRPAADTAVGTTVDDAAPLARSSPFQPVYSPQDDTYCWVCGGDVIKRHCKIVCQACGFTRDCGDP
jgi:8-oxo-dGTP diphosphatase